MGGQGHPRQAPVCDGLQERTAGQGDCRAGGGQGQETGPGGAAGTAPKGAGPGCEEHGAVGGAVLR